MTEIELDCNEINKVLKIVELYNSIGEHVRTIKTSQDNASISVNMSSLPSGIYFLRLIGENWSKTQKIIKQ